MAGLPCMSGGQSHETGGLLLPSVLQWEGGDDWGSDIQEVALNGKNNC